MPSMKTIQPYVFLAADTFKNGRLPCDSSLIEDFDLFPWIEQRPSTNRRRFDFFRFISRRSSRSTKDKNKRKNSNNQKQPENNRKTSNSTQIGKSSYSQPSLPNNIYNNDYLNKPKGGNQINISISNLPTPLPHPIQINIKIKNGGSTTERYSSTVSKRKKPSNRPTSYDSPNINIVSTNNNNKPFSDGTYYSSINNLKPGNTYDHLFLQTPSAKPQHSYSVVTSSKPSASDYHKPVSSYNSNFAVINSQRPSGDTYTKPSHFYGGVATSGHTSIHTPIHSSSYQQSGSTEFEESFSDDSSRPFQRPHSDTYTRPNSFYGIVGTSSQNNNGYNRKPVKQTEYYHVAEHQDFFNNGVVQIFPDGSYSSGLDIVLILFYFVLFLHRINPLGSVVPVKPSSVYHNGFGSQNSDYDDVDLEDSSFGSANDKYSSNKYRPVDIMSDLYTELEDEYSSTIDIPKKPNFGQYYGKNRFLSI